MRSNAIQTYDWPVMLVVHAGPAIPDLARLTAAYHVLLLSQAAF